MNPGYYLKGSTVRLTARFHNWDETLATPSEVKLLIYDSEWQKLQEYPISEDSRDLDGNYVYNFVADTEGAFYWEWYGLLDGLPSIQRGPLNIRQI